MVGLEWTSFESDNIIGIQSWHKIWCSCVYLSLYLFILSSFASLIFHLSTWHIERAQKHFVLNDYWRTDCNRWGPGPMSWVALERSPRAWGAEPGSGSTQGLGGGWHWGRKLAQPHPASSQMHSLGNHFLSLGLGLLIHKTGRMFLVLGVLLSFLWF